MGRIRKGGGKQWGVLSVSGDRHACCSVRGLPSPKSPSPTGYCCYCLCFRGAEVDLQDQRVCPSKMVLKPTWKHVYNREVNSLGPCPSIEYKARPMEPPKMEAELHYRCYWCSGSHKSLGTVISPVTRDPDDMGGELEGCRGPNTTILTHILLPLQILLFAKDSKSRSHTHSVKHLSGAYCVPVRVLSQGYRNEQDTVLVLGVQAFCWGR